MILSVPNWILWKRITHLHKISLQTSMFFTVYLLFRLRLKIPRYLYAHAYSRKSYSLLRLIYVCMGGSTGRFINEWMNERMNENYSYYKVYLYVWHKKFDPVRFITKLAIVYNLKYLYADKFEKISIEVKWGGGTRQSWICYGIIIV